MEHQIADAPTGVEAAQSNWEATRMHALAANEEIQMATLTSDVPAAKVFISWRQAAFIGVGSMVGAGIFSLLGAAGEVAGAAVWLSFLLAGVVAALQGYSFAKFGARYPSAAGLLEYVSAGFGRGTVTGITAWMTLSVN